MDHVFRPLNEWGIISWEIVSFTLGEVEEVPAQ